MPTNLCAWCHWNKLIKLDKLARCFVSMGVLWLSLSGNNDVKDRTHSRLENDT